MIQTTSSAVDWFGQRRDSKMLGQINTVRDLIAAEGSPRLADSFFVGGELTFAALRMNGCSIPEPEAWTLTSQ